MLMLHCSRQAASSSATLPSPSGEKGKCEQLAAISENWIHVVVTMCKWQPGTLAAALLRNNGVRQLVQCVALHVESKSRGICANISDATTSNALVDEEDILCIAAIEKTVVMLCNFVFFDMLLDTASTAPKRRTWQWWRSASNIAYAHKAGNANNQKDGGEQRRKHLWHQRKHQRLQKQLFIVFHMLYSSSQDPHAPGVSYIRSAYLQDKKNIFKYFCSDSADGTASSNSWYRLHKKFWSERWIISGWDLQGDSGSLKRKNHLPQQPSYQQWPKH